MTTRSRHAGVDQERPSGYSLAGGSTVILLLFIYHFSSTGPRYIGSGTGKKTVTIFHLAAAAYCIQQSKRARTLKIICFLRPVCSLTASSLYAYTSAGYSAIKSFLDYYIVFISFAARKEPLLLPRSIQFNLKTKKPHT